MLLVTATTGYWLLLPLLATATGYCYCYWLFIHPSIHRIASHRIATWTGYHHHKPPAAASLPRLLSHSPLGRQRQFTHLSTYPVIGNHRAFSTVRLIPERNQNQNQNQDQNHYTTPTSSLVPLVPLFPCSLVSGLVVLLDRYATTTPSIMQISVPCPSLAPPSSLPPSTLHTHIHSQFKTSSLVTRTVTRHISPLPPCPPVPRRVLFGCVWVLKRQSINNK